MKHSNQLDLLDMIGDSDIASRHDIAKWKRALQNKSKKKYRDKTKHRLLAAKIADKNGLPIDPWVLKHKETIKNWKIRNRDSIILKRRDKAKLTPEAVRLRKLRALPIEEKNRAIAESRRLWFRKNGARIYAKIKNNPEKLIAQRLRIRLNKMMKRYKAVRCGTSKKLLGCSFEEFRNHIEKQFKEGMNWSNYGEWHIDHIAPCASFDLTLSEHQKKCFHFTNLQPLWAIENRIKGSRLLL